jgi:hypothetical protein
MISTKKTAGIEDKHISTDRHTAITKGKMNITSSKVIRWSGLAAMVSGLIYVAIQPIHPTDILSSVTTTQWAIVHYLSLTMDFLGLLGMAGLYTRQVEKAGWLGLAGYLVFSLFYALALAFHFLEAFISPALATEAPKFVAGLLGMVTGTPSHVSLGGIPAAYGLLGLAYLLGGALFGIATFRAGILPRWAGGLLAIGAALTLAGAFVPHPFDRIFAVPVGLALAWLGYALFSERREKTSQALLDQRASQMEPSKVA